MTPSSPASKTYKHTTEFRVRYSETDRMGYVYYGNYSAWFEVGRVELLRTLGLTYKEHEDKGLILPVRDFSVRYMLPIKYDDVVVLETELQSVKGPMIVFGYRLYTEDGKVACRASTSLVFANRFTGRPIKCPQPILDLFED